VLLPSVVVSVVVLVPVVPLASGAGCWTPGSVAPMVALALLSVFATWSLVGLVVVLVSAEALGLGCCTPGSVAPMVALAPCSMPSFCCSSATSAPQLPAALAAPAARIKLAQFAAESHAAAVDEIERIVGAERIDCDFKRLDGYLFHPEGDPDLLILELDAVRRAGITAGELVERVPIDGYDFGRALRFPNQGQFHILSYLRGLAMAATKNGAWIHNGTHVMGVEPGHPARVTTAKGPVVTADAVVIATNTPVIDRVTMHAKQAACRTYVVAGRIPEESVPRLLLWDTLDPYHYVRTQHGEAGFD
jgi:glycine/D-amino acid oxidase-like deaminating enzyme